MIRKGERSTISRFSIGPGVLISDTVEMNVRKRFLAAFAVVLFLPFYAFFIEPYWIEVSHHQIQLPVKTPLKVMQLSDLHIRSVGRRERAVLELISNENPDLIAVTGDFVSDAGNDEAVFAFLRELRAPLGVWLIRGNWEYFKGQNVEPKLRELSNLKILVNKSARAREDVWVVGLDDFFTGQPDESGAFSGVPDSVMRLALFHSPEAFDAMKSHFDLGLSGHTHAGQFRLPFLPPLWLPPASGRFIEGWYEREGKKMYVSRGVGNSLIDARLFCRPEIAIFTIAPMI